MGNVDISLAGKSNPAVNSGSKVSLGGNTITASGTRYSITFKPYYELDYEFATMNGTTEGNFNTADIDFNGLMTARVISDMGQFVAYYPAAESVDSENDARDKNKISIGSGDVLYSTNNGGYAAIASYLRLGVDASVSGCNGDFCFDGSKLPGVSTISPLITTSCGVSSNPNIAIRQIQLSYDNMVEFGFQPSGSSLSCSTYRIS